jgi:hypothetical protein
MSDTLPQPQGVQTGPNFSRRLRYAAITATAGFILANCGSGTDADSHPSTTAARVETPTTTTVPGMVEGTDPYADILVDDGYESDDQVPLVPPDDRDGDGVKNKDDLLHTVDDSRLDLTRNGWLDYSEQAAFLGLAPYGDRDNDGVLDQDDLAHGTDDTRLDIFPGLDGTPAPDGIADYSQQTSYQETQANITIAHDQTVYDELNDLLRVDTSTGQLTPENDWDTVNGDGDLEPYSTDPNDSDPLG